MALIQGHRSASALATNMIQVLKIKRDKFAEFNELMPGVRAELLEMLEFRRKEAETVRDLKLEEQMSQAAAQKQLSATIGKIRTATRLVTDLQQSGNRDTVGDAAKRLYERQTRASKQRTGASMIAS